MTEHSSRELMMANEKEKYHKQLTKRRITLLTLIAVLLVAVVLACCAGVKGVNAQTVIRVLLERWIGSEGITGMQRTIVLDIRIPRVLGAAFAGVLLAGAGILMQSVLQNPLASPYTLGVSNGAALGATVAIVFGSLMGLPAYNTWMVPGFAFVFSIISMLAVILVSKVARDSSKTLLLAGVAVGYLISAVTALIKYMADTVKLPELVFWSMGGIAGISWDKVKIMLITTLVACVILVWKAPKFHVMAAGEETALSLGVNYKRMRVVSFTMATLMTAVAVSFVGVVGFIGLVAPHLSRILVGNDFRSNCPVAVTLGALILVISDTIARTIILPSEIPVGIVTSFLGVPFFLMLIIQRGRRF